MMKPNLTDLVTNMPPNRFLELYGRGEDMALRSGTYDDLKKIGADPNKFHCIGVYERIGFSRFQVHLEKMHFDPNVSLNDEYEFRLVKHYGILFVIISIPLAKKESAYESASATNMQLVKGVPVLGEEIFPLGTDVNTVVVKNAAGDRVYSGDAGDLQDARIEEEFQIRKIHGTV